VVLGLGKLTFSQRHTNDMYTEKEEELDSLAIRHAATEAYVDELRLRVAKLTERESATEVRYPPYVVGPVN
jgi:hypothetical protein